MQFRPTRSWLLGLLASSVLLGWSPRFHETQTRMAVKMVPKGMTAFLETHREALLEGARGVGSDQPPTVEDLEAQIQRIVALSEAKKRPELIIRELGVLAKLTQLLNDPSVSIGVTPMRATFEAYADERVKDLVLTREPFWGVTDPLDPRPRLVAMADQKFGRLRRLAECVDPATGARVGSWDGLSVPFAQLQLGFSSGVNATANLWILLWRGVGELWIPAPA